MVLRGWGRERSRRDGVGDGAREREPGGLVWVRTPLWTRACRGGSRTRQRWSAATNNTPEELYLTAAQDARGFFASWR